MLHDYETSAVMWCLLSSSSWQVGSLTFRQAAHSFPCRNWRLQYSSSALEATLGAEFDLSSLKTSLIRVVNSGTGHHWPRLCGERDEFSPKITLSRPSPCAITLWARTAACVACRRDRGGVGRGVGGQCCTMTDSALHASGHICSHF